MKQTKQFLRPLLMAIVMLVGMLVPQGAWAEEYPVIIGGTHTINIAAYRDGYTEFSHYTTIFKYVAPKGGTLTVYTEGNGDTASAFFDEDKKTLTYDDNSGYSLNFKFSYKVVKDHTYYIGVCSSKDFTNYTLVIDESDLCDHEIVNHVCTICGKHQSRIVSVPAGVTVTDDDGNPITSEDYIWEGRTVNISVNASEVTAPIYIGLDATTAEGSSLNIRRNNSFVMPGSDVTLNYMAIPSEPLCFEALEAGAKIGFSSIVSDYILYYSTDKENWTSFNYNDTHYLPTLANAGDKIYLIGNVTSSSAWSYTQVKIENANVAASGKLSYILGGATTIYDFGCYKMFYYNGNLISAPDMSDITEIGECGCYEMFRGCSALTTAPAMSSLTAIGERGCDFMFYGCSALTTAPAMSSLTTIGDEGCNQMFGDCSALTTAPAMSSLTAIGYLGCDGMFSRCPQLTGFELNTVPYVGNYAFNNFGTGNITLKLSADSYVYVGENPGFPTVTSVTAPCTLNLTGSVVENHANLVHTNGERIVDAAVAPTCTTTGLTEGSHCSLCNMPFVAQVEIEALGHDYHVQLDENEKPVFVWSEDYTSATLQLVCSRDEEHTANVEVTGEGITSEDTTPATCTTAGVRTYTAKATYKGVEYTGTKEVEIPATGHDYTNKTLTASPVEDGLYAYACENGCGAHNSVHIIKDFNGIGNRLKLSKDGEGNYCTSSDVILDDGTAFATPVKFTVPSDQIKVERTFTASKPATVMLPFSIEASLVQGATFSEFGGVSYDEEKAQWVATMTSVSTTLLAYTPYIVMLDEGNVTGKVTFGNESADVATFVVTPDASTMQTADANGWTFKAVNAAKTWAEGDPEIGKAYGFAGKDKTVGENEIHRGDFVKIAAGASAKPGRCYLVKNDGEPLTRATEELPATIKVRFIVGSATGIGTLDTETGEMTLEGWYDLNGNKIEQPSKGGVYINNNKKVMVK